MKIFILIPWFQPAYKAGGPIQSVANMVKAMGNGQSATGNVAMEFKILCSNKDIDGILLQGVAFDEWVPYNAYTKVWYSSSGNILPVLQDEIKKEKPAFLFITGIYDWQFNARPLLFCKGVKKIISVRGMLHPGALRQKGFKKKIYLGLWKMLGLHKQAVFHATDKEEQEYIQQVFGPSSAEATEGKSKVRIVVAANFPNVLDVQPVVVKEPGHLKLVSIALISPMKNILWVLKALMDIGDEKREILRYTQDDRLRGEGLSRESSVVSRELGVGSQEEKCVIGDSSEVGGPSSVVNSIEYNIYGPIKDIKYWQACEEQIKKLPPNITVNYHGDIAPDKITDALAANHVFILPSKSENYGHSIIEALFAGRPVITSNNTPWNELKPVNAGINISLINKQELVDAVNHFALMSQEEMEIWSKCARVFAEKKVNTNEIRKQYDELFG